MCKNVPDSIQENMEELFACHAPHNLYMLNSDDRLQFFTKNWPLKRCVTPCKMVDAGFYYLDDSDRVICFYLMHTMELSPLFGTRSRLEILDAQWKIAQHNTLALKSTILKLSTSTISQLLN